MKTDVRQTSLEAFFQTQNTLNRREHQLFTALKEIQPACDRDLARKLDWEIGQVNGRRNALVEKERIVEAYKAKNPVTKRTVIYWKVSNEEAL